ncbi:hypothetical protein HZS_1075 [Henneguya salminicola]|nr:hypothetical protein HZS_1075 [Henneguya salminicola]
MYLKKWVVFESVPLIISYAKIFLLSTFIYPITYFYYHSTVRAKYIWASFYSIYLIYFFVYTFKSCYHKSLSSLSVTILCMEGVRLTLKIHSFFRENMRLSLIPDRPFAKFSQMLYYFFAPTTIYRDNYPRKKKIKILKAMKYFVQFMSAFIASCIIYECYLIPRLIKVSQNPLSFKVLFFEVLSNCVPSTAFMILMFFFYLHAFQNFFAEILRFGDRLFYTDWWNAKSYSEFYKTWNIVVQDWLRTYIFNDLRRILPVSVRNAISSIAVITLSSIVHEYIMFMIVGSFCPAITISFGGFGGFLYLIHF